MIDKIVSTITIFVALILFTLLLAIVPVITIWSLNTLFGLHIPYTISTMVAMGILLFLLKAN